MGLLDFFVSSSGVYKRGPRFEGSKENRKHFPWSYLDAAAAGSSAGSSAASAAVSDICILSCTSTGAARCVAGFGVADGI